jgi:transposase
VEAGEEASLYDESSVLDLRQRVIGAIGAGMSCRAAATRFGIAPSVAVKWRRLWLETGSVAPRAQGGDTRSGRIEAVGAEILAMVAAAPDITLAEMAERLEREHGQRFAPSTVHRFFRRRGWSYKKRVVMPASRTVRMLPQRGRSGSRRSRIWTRSG